MIENRTRPTVMDRLRARAERRHAGESGLALLDVLLGMAIFALIAVIAVQSMGSFRARAYVTQASSDAQQLAVGLEAYVTDASALPAVSGEFPDSDGAGTVASATNQTPIGVNLTAGNFIRNYTVSGVAYSFCIVNPDGAWVYYRSAIGSIANSGTTAPTGTWNQTTNPCV